MYTKEDRQIAKALCSDPKYLELIAKVFLEEEDKLSIEFVTQKTNDQLGEIVRANTLAEIKVKNRYATLKRLSSETPGKPKPAAKA